MFDTYKDVLTVEQVCSALSMGKNSVYNLLRNGVIKSIKIGKKYLIPKSFLIDFINSFKWIIIMFNGGVSKRKE